MHDNRKWKAEYMALKAGIKDEQTVKIGERIVSSAIRLSEVTAKSFDECFEAMLKVTKLMENKVLYGTGMKQPKGLIQSQRSNHGRNT